MQQNQTKDIIRLGPRPLWLHLNAGAAMMATIASDEGMFAASGQILNEAMNGVMEYHNSPVRPFVRDMKIVADNNGSKFITGNDWDGKDVVLLIPSLINGWHIFDIEEDFSFAAYLKGQGTTPLILDWAEPLSNDISLDDYITLHLKPLIDALINDGYRIKGMVGYCMGGTIIAALLSAYPELRDNVGKKILIATPWDFSGQTIDQTARLQAMGLQTYAMSSPVPVDFVQSLFWAIDPLQVLKKFRRFPYVQNPSRFVRVEDWLNEGRAVSLSVIQTCLFDWYRDNKIAKGEWNLNGHPVTAQSLGMDVMVAMADKDSLVPDYAVLPMVDQMPDATFVQVDTGHIGLMASDKSVAGLWKPVADFLK